MSRRSLSHLSDPALRISIKTSAAGERTSIADLVAHIAEYDTRKLYVPDGHSSMFEYCVSELLLSPDATARRIQAARVVQRFPAVLDALDDGRLNLTAVGLLSPHLTEGNAQELLAAAEGKSKTEIELFLAARFPRSEVMAWVAGMPASSAAGSDDQHALAHVQGSPDAGAAPEEPQHAPAHVDRSRVKPLSAESFDVQFPMCRRAHEKLRYVQELLSHQIPSGDIAEIFERGLDALIPQLEKVRFAASDKPRRHGPRVSADPRHIPAHVTEAVWKRDGGQCTYESESGHRCQERKFIQFDHILEVARGGESTVDNLRLRCRAHNQFEAERTFGVEFMRHKRAAAAEARVSRKPANPAPPHVEEVVPYLRQLRYKEADARSAAALCENMPNASLEDRVRAALKYFRVRGARWVPEAIPASAV